MSFPPPIRADLEGSCPSFDHNNSIQNICTRTALSVWNTLQLASLTVSSFICYALTYIVEKIVAFVNWLFNCESSDENRLVLAKTTIPYHYQEWYRNFSVMRDIYNRTDDPEVKSLIKFLISNYLNPNADTDIKLMALLGSSLDITKFHCTTPLATNHYHRYAFIDNVQIAAKFNKDLVMSGNSPLIPIDTRAISELFPVYFTILDSSNHLTWADSLTKVLEDHFSSHDLKTPLDSDILLDASELLSPYIHKKAENNFNQEYTKLKADLDQAIATVVARFPQYNKKKLKKYLQRHITGVVHFDMPEFAGIKVLPLFQKNEASQFLTKHPRFRDFLAYTGSFIGGIGVRRHLINPFKEYEGVHLATRGEHLSSTTPLQQIHETQLFSTLITRFEQHSNPAIKNLGQATLKLIQGLESRVNYQAIDPAKRELLAQTLFILFVHLGDANHNIDRAFDKFTNSIKLVHYDLQALLAITTPYQYSDFGPIYFESLPELAHHRADAGLAKSAMNVFAGVNNALLHDPEKQNKLVRVYAQTLYFENVNFLTGGIKGNSYSLDQALNDPSITTIDLFACEFNPNTCIASNFTHYDVGNVVENIHKIFQKKPATNKLTVAVDVTIDYSHSENVTKLLETFKDEIDSGRICFIFFQSGQKFAMLGMDNYFGAPYAVFHNGSEKWSHFKFLSESQALKTDLLSLQWFCLSNEFISQELNEYRGLIFENTRKAVENLPKYLHNPSARLRVNTFDAKMDACFIDIKVMGPFHKMRASIIIGELYRRCLKKKISILSRASFGFHHMNVLLIQINEVPHSSTIRINPGTNPEEVRLLRRFLKKLECRL